MGSHLNPTINSQLNFEFIVGFFVVSFQIVFQEIEF